LKQEFANYQIPCFMDDKNSLMRNPLVEFIRSALALASGDFSYEKVFRHLKCGLFDIKKEDRDFLENYVIAMGIRSEKRWNVEWNRSYKDSGTIDFVYLNQIRSQVVEKLLLYKEKLGKRNLSLKERVRALVEMMMEARLEEKLVGFSKWLEETGEPFLSSEYEQAYPLVIDLFDEMVALLGEEEISLEEFTILLDSGLEEIKVGFIPEGVDRITVGDMERTRLSGIKALFFIGVNEGKVPKAPGTGGIFTDYDKEQLSLMKIELSPTAKKNSFIQQFYLYLALTRASERLFITYAKNDAQGKSQRPSVCLCDILKLFPRLVVKEEGDEQLDGKNWTDKNSALSFYIKGLSEVKKGTIDNDWLELFNHYRRHDEKKEKALSLLHAAFGSYERETLGKELARKLYGEILAGSVSRLELQSSCAYAQFLRYGLELAKRKEYTFQAVDIGNIFHMAIESVFNVAKEEKIALGSLEDGERKELVHRCVEQVVLSYGNRILDDSARNRWLGGRLERITERTIWALSRQLAESGFTPDGVEVVFSAENSDALLLDLSEDEKMHLTGRIDRLDIKEEKDKIYVRIVDYKSGSTSFDLVSVYQGLQLQLVFYLEAAMENLAKRNPDKEIHPGGVLYYNIKEPLVDKTPKMSEEDIKQKLLEQMQMNGLMNVEAGEKEEKQIKNVAEEKLEDLKGYVDDTVHKLGKEILEGDIRINPYKKGNKQSCTYCEYQSICGFDSKISGYKYRNLVTIPAEEIWEELSKRGEKKDGNEVDESSKSSD
jgi:ATP-dependent helicase/nuclease subunit B